MKKEVKSIGIYKPMETVSFSIGSKVSIGGVETENTVEKIIVGPFRKSEVYMSGGMILVFEGFPISYEL